MPNLAPQLARPPWFGTGHAQARPRRPARPSCCRRARRARPPTKLTITRRRLRPRHRHEPVRRATATRSTADDYEHILAPLLHGHRARRARRQPRGRGSCCRARRRASPSPARLDRGRRASCDPAQTYSVRRGAGGPASARPRPARRRHRRRARCASTRPVGSALRAARHLGARACATAGTAARWSPRPRLGGVHGGQRARPRGLRARRRQRREPAAGRPRRSRPRPWRRAPTRSRRNAGGAPASTSTPTRARRSTAASRPRRPTTDAAVRPPTARS